LPHNYKRNVAAYTGTHDNDTTAGWWESVTGNNSARAADDVANERDLCQRYLDSDGAEIHWEFIRALLASVADTAIIPLQDVLGVGSEGRMNLPNSTEGNWSWRFSRDALTNEHRDRLRELTEIYGRTRPAKAEN
jgi:4-alpha-glucanotransferase